jgi:cholesterol oxidase
MPHLDRLDLPITFLHGADNKVWVPKSTEVTYDLLRKEFGDANYRRIVFQGYGHLDPVFGKHAARDTYTAFLDHLDRVGA